MTPEELYENFFNTCVIWAEDNGGAPVDLNNLCDLDDNGDGTITIVNWYSAAPEPSNSDLETYTVDEVNTRIAAFYNQQKIEAATILTFTTSERDALTPPEGAIIYNSTTKTIQLFTTVWNDLTMTAE